MVANNFNIFVFVLKEKENNNNSLKVVQTVEIF